MKRQQQGSRWAKANHRRSITTAYRRLLRILFPGAFYRRVGDSLTDTFDTAFHEALSTGRGAATFFLVRALVDLLTQGPAEHLCRLRGVEPYAREPKRVAPRRRGGAQLALDSLGQDLRFATRALFKSPGFSCAAIATLALTIGANGAMFSLVNGILLSPLPYKDAGDIVQLVGTARGQEMNRHSYPNFLDYAEQTHSLVDLAPIQHWSATVLFERPERMDGLSVGAGYFPALAISPHLGRFFQPADDRRGHEKVAVVSYSFFRDHLGERPDALGESLKLGDEHYTVIGVTPKDFEDPFVQARFYRSPPEHFYDAKRTGNWLHVIGRLAPESSLTTANAELQSVLESLKAEYPAELVDLEVGLVTLHEAIVGDTRATLLVLFAAIASILLIGCANVAHFMLARASSRSREVAVRLALGSSRVRVTRQLLTECLVLGSVAGMFGIGLAKLFLSVIVQQAGSRVPRTADISLDGTTILFIAAISVLTGVAFGILPSIRWARTSLIGALRSATPGSSDRSSTRLRSLLVAAEVAVAVTLLTSSGLLLQSFRNLASVDTGLDTERLLSFNLQAGVDEHPQGKPLFEFRRQMVETLETVPGVISVGLTNALPLAGMQQGWTVTRDDLPPPQPGSETIVEARAISHSFPVAAGIEVLEGRQFNSADRSDTQPVALASESLVRRLFPEGHALGKSVTLHDTSWLIVGVIGDVRENTVADVPEPALYTLAEQGATPDWMQRWIGVILQVEGDPASLTDLVREGVWKIDPAIPVTSMQTMNERVENSLVAPRLRAFVLSSLSILGLLLATFGITAVVTHSVTSRASEIALRKALGADRSAITRLIVREGLTMAGLGLVGGLVGSFLAAQAVAAFLFDVGPYDLATFGSVSIFLLLVAAIAAYIPARRAANGSALVAIGRD